MIGPRATAADGLATAICVAGEALAPTLLAAYPQMRAMLTRLDGTSMACTAKGGAAVTTIGVSGPEARTMTWRSIVRAAAHES